MDRYFYSSAANVTEGDYAALLSFATHYGYPLAFYQCPDLAAFQASHSSAVVRPFSKVPPAFIQRGYELQSSFRLSSSDASPASPSGGLAASSGASFPSQCNNLVSLLSHVSTVPSAQGSFWGHDHPSVAAATRTSSAFVSSVGFNAPPPPRASSACPDPDGVDVPPPFMGGAGGPGGPCFFGRSSSSYGYPPHWSSLGSGFSTSLTAAANYRNYNFPGPIPEEIPKVVFGWGHPPPPCVMGDLMMLLLLLPHLPHIMGGLIRLLFLLRLGDIVMPLHLRRLRLHLQLHRTVLCPMAISLPLPCRT